MEESKNKKPSGRRPERDSVNPDEILRIALKRFARQGYGGLTLNGLAKETGVTDSLLHYHFGGKEELWKKALQKVGKKISDELVELIRLVDDLDGLQQLKLFNKKVVYISAKYPEFQQIIVQEVFSESPRSEWLIEELLQPIYKFMTDIIEAEVRKGRIKDIPTANLTSFIIGSITTLFSRSYQMKKLYGVDAFDEEVVEEHASIINDLIFEGLLKK
ncbi:MAG: TetR/AcrR family transcriptional regulator [Bacteroidota bacterium]